MKLILASGSPRRRELLSELGYSFDVCPADFDESTVDLSTPEDGVQALAAGKAHASLEALKKSGADVSGTVFLGSDTVVVHGGAVLGKPADKEDAKRMLKMLSGDVHKVCTGTAFVTENGTGTDVSVTEVYFYDLSDEEIDRYIASGEPMDKAGAYGIQGLGRTLVRKIDGDYFTVVGLPVAETYRKLLKYGIKPLPIL